MVVISWCLVDGVFRVKTDGQKIVPTGIAIDPPPGTYVRIAPRSGLALKGITVEGGVIDPDYRGEVNVLLINSSQRKFQIHKGDRIAQLIFEQRS